MTNRWQIGALLLLLIAFRCLPWTPNSGFRCKATLFAGFVDHFWLFRVAFLVPLVALGFHFGNKSDVLHHFGPQVTLEHVCRGGYHPGRPATGLVR